MSLPPYAFQRGEEEEERKNSVKSNTKEEKFMVNLYLQNMEG
jgi:hypothetical protein